MDREGRAQADARRILAQQARADAVEGARPGQPARRGGAGPRGAVMPLGAPRHLLGRAPRKGQQQDPLRVDTVAAISHATRWASVLVLPDPAPAMISRGRIFTVLAMLDGTALLGVERLERVKAGGKAGVHERGAEDG